MRSSLTMSSTWILALVAVGGAAGCGVKDPTEAHVELADAKLTIDQPDGKHHELAVATNGAVTWDGKPVVTIGAKGALKADGKVIAKIDKHGVMTIGGQPTNVAVTRDGAFIMDGTPELTITREGVVDGPLVASLDHPAVVLEGSKLAYVGPPAGRQAVLLGFATLITPQLTPPSAR